MPYELSLKPTFLHQLTALPQKYAMQIMQKVETLCADPAPLEPVKKRLHGVKGNLYRLRSGDYRILYTYGDGWVCLLGVDNRKDIYKHLPDTISLPRTSAEELATVGDVDSLCQYDDIEDLNAPAQSFTTESVEAANEDEATIDAMLTLERVPVISTTHDEPLPRSIDLNLLKRLRIPTLYHQILLRCLTFNDLCAASVPPTIADAVFDSIMRPDYELVRDQQPDLQLSNVDELRRYIRGELSGFLLRLSPEQSKFVTWGLHSPHPTLLKGAPGTGKTTIALFRAIRMLELLHREGMSNPRILITTYNKSLATAASNLLAAMPGNDIPAISVQTADGVAYRLLRDYGKLGSLSIPSRFDESVLIQTLRRAREHKHAKPLARDSASTRSEIDYLTDEYLLEELLDVIEARQLNTWEAYASATRTGRRLPLTKAQRRRIWNVHEEFVRLLAASGFETWQQRRARAADVAMTIPRRERYDAVFIDEAQDLDLSALRMLVHLCVTKGRLFVTADACQSIYGSGFRWADLHDEVGLRASVRSLSRSYRSTRQIGEAAWSYLGEDAIDPEEKRRYCRKGQRPELVHIAMQNDEAKVIANKLRKAAAQHRVSFGSCAVLTASRRSAKRIVTHLSEQGIAAVFMERDDVELDHPDVKVMTLHAAKGLDFPIVVLAGFFDGRMVKTPRGNNSEAEAEWLARNRRTMFVGMTRAMNSLTVIIPEHTQASALSGFDPKYWRVSGRHSRN